MDTKVVISGFDHIYTAPYYDEDEFEDKKYDIKSEIDIKEEDDLSIKKEADELSFIEDETKEEPKEEPLDEKITFEKVKYEEYQEDETAVKKLSGVASFLKKLRSNDSKPGRIVLDSEGKRIVKKEARPMPICRIGEVVQTIALADQQEGIDFEQTLCVPTEVHAVRQMIRSKMLRCKRCKNRFVEKNLYERHLRDRHPADYKEYIEEQEAEMEIQRLEELESNRIEELQAGGFIPPESEIENDSHNLIPEVIPLPGENNGGICPVFDSFGRVKSQKRPFKRKISPQCPFCDKRFRNEISLKKHFTKKHEEMLEFQQCTRCYKCLTDEEDQKNHKCELTYVCFECVPIRNLCTDVRLVNHRKKFHRGPNSGFKCSFCNLKFLTPRKLRKHKKMSHVFTKTYQCHFCDEHFISEVAVMTHERIHTGIIKFECKVCDFKANRFVQMEEHMRIEHGYVCSICQEKVTELPELKHHTLQAHGGYLSADAITGHIESPRMWLLYKGE